MKQFVLSLIAVFVCSSLQAQYYDFSYSDTDMDAFLLEYPAEDDDLESKDTSGIDAEYHYAVLDKKINSYFYYVTTNNNSVNVKGATLTVQTEYIRDIVGVAHLITFQLEKTKKWAFKVFSKSGSDFFMSSEEEDLDFDLQIKKHVRPGDIVRFWYASEESSPLYQQFFLSETVPVKSCKLILQAGNKMKYVSKGFNGMELTEEEEKDGYDVKVYEGTNLPVNRDELHKTTYASMAKVLNTIRSIEDVTRGDINDYEQIKNILYGNYMVEDYSLRKKIDGHYLKSKVHDIKGIDAKVKAIDEYMKDNFVVLNLSYLGIRFSFNFSKFFDEEILSPKEAIKYYTHMLRKEKIEYEMVVTSNRTKNEFTKDFEHFDLWDYTFIYITETEKFLLPTSENILYGQLPVSVKDNKALYIKKDDFGREKIGKWSVKKIDGRGKDENSFSDHLKLDIKKQSASLHTTLVGDFAQTFLNKEDKLFFDDKEEIAQNLSAYYDKKAVLRDYEVLFYPEDDSVTISTEFEMPSLVQKEGEQYKLFIGKWLGNPDTLSPVEKRQSGFALLPSDNHGEVILDLPEGYSVSNLADYNLKVTKEGLLVYEVKAEVNGQTLFVNIHNAFDKMVYTLEEYPTWKEAYDAANKLYHTPLLLTKK